MKILLIVVLTAYTAFDDGMTGLGITFTGTHVREHHTIAVDPQVIPLGSLVFIPSRSHLPNRGFYRAEDTGSAIIGNRIDVYIPLRQEALEFGVQRSPVVVIDPDEPLSRMLTRAIGGEPCFFSKETSPIVSGPSPITTLRGEVNSSILLQGLWQGHYP